MAEEQHPCPRAPVVATSKAEPVPCPEPRTAEEFRTAAAAYAAAGNSIQAKAHQHAAQLAEREVASAKRAAERAHFQSKRKAARAAEREIAAAERARIKQLPNSRAAKWAAGLAKDIGVCATLIEQVPAAPNVLESVKTEYAKRFREWLTKLQTLRQSMDNCSDEDEASRLLAAGPCRSPNAIIAPRLGGGK